MCVLLADFLRDSVRFGGRNQITLGQEFSLLRQYLGIEQIRFGKRLAVREDMDPALEPALVPPLLLQPIVENAVKHGIAGLIEGGTIEIHAAASAGELVLTVRNPFDVDRPAASGTRTGLQNVKRRLDTEFGPSASLRVVEQEGVFVAEIRLPLAKTPEMKLGPAEAQTSTRADTPPADVGPSITSGETSAAAPGFTTPARQRS